LGSNLDEVTGIFDLPNPSSHTMALESTLMSARILPGDKWRPERKTDNLTAIYEPIV
jgi:hypothetical protein